MNLTKGIGEDVELSSIITEDYHAFGQALMKHTAKEGALCDYFDMSIIDDLQLF